MALRRKIIFPHQFIATAIKAKRFGPFTSHSKEKGCGACPTIYIFSSFCPSLDSAAFKMLASTL